MGSEEPRLNGLLGMLQLHNDRVSCLVDQLRSDLIPIVIQHPSLGPLLCGECSPISHGKLLCGDIERGTPEKVFGPQTSISLSSGIPAAHNLIERHHYPITCRKTIFKIARNEESEVQVKTGCYRAGYKRPLPKSKWPAQYTC